MKFLKLLDPSELRKNDISAPGMQQARAAELFPKLVEESNLHYWRPGYPVHSTCNRLLVGLAAPFHLGDLHLADIMNDELLRVPNIHVDVFDVHSDCSCLNDLQEYFPGISIQQHPASPIVGKWENGVIREIKFGFEARKYVLELLCSSTRANDLLATLSSGYPNAKED